MEDYPDEFDEHSADYEAISIEESLPAESEVTVRQVNPALECYYGVDPSITKEGSDYIKEKTYTVGAESGSYEFLVPESGTVTVTVSVDGEDDVVYTFNCDGVIY